MKKGSTRAKPYFVSIKIFGKIYSSTAPTLAEAIANLKPEAGARGMGILTVKKGLETQEKILPRLVTARLFATSVPMRAYALKTTLERFSL